MVIEVTVLDRSHHLHKILGQDKKTMLLNALFEMMYRDLMSDVDVSPKFDGTYWKDGTFKLKAVNAHSAEFLVDIVERMPPPWPGAEIYVEYGSKRSVPAAHTYVPETRNDVPEMRRTVVPEMRRTVVPEMQRTVMPEIQRTVVVEAYVQGDVVQLEEFLDTISRFDNRIRTDRWQSMGYRPHGQGHVYTFTIQQTDFQCLNDYDGFIPFYGTQVEFRVLKNANLIPQ